MSDNKQSVIEFLKNYAGVKNFNNAVLSISKAVDAISEKEEILYWFSGNSGLIQINRGRSSVTNYIAVLTSKKLIYAGTDGKSSIFLQQPKMGTIDIRDVHAISVGSQALQGQYLIFECKNEDYKFIGLNSAETFKLKLEEAIESAEKIENNVISIQQVSSADEIKKFKELFDLGIITQEEFDAKKKQLLGL